MAKLIVLHPVLELCPELQIVPPGQEGWLRAKRADAVVVHPREILGDSVPPPRLARYGSFAKVLDVLGTPPGQER